MSHFVARPQNGLIKLKVDYEFQPLAMKPKWRKRFDIRRTAERFLRILAGFKTFPERRGAEGRIAGRPFLCFFLFDVKRKKVPSGGATPVPTLKNNAAGLKKREHQHRFATRKN